MSIAACSRKNENRLKTLENKTLTDFDSGMVRFSAIRRSTASTRPAHHPHLRSGDRSRLRSIPARHQLGKWPLNESIFLIVQNVRFRTLDLLNGRVRIRCLRRSTDSTPVLRAPRWCSALSGPTNMSPSPISSIRLAIRTNGGRTSLRDITVR